MNNSQRPVIFCDFDGTITVNDNIVAIMKHFNPPGVETIIEQVIHQKMSIREGVGKMFSLLPSSRKEEIVQFAIENAEIRSGFKELLDFCKEQDIEFYVTSGGIDFFVYPLLKPFQIPEDHIFCNGSSFAGEHIEILWPHACDESCNNDCGMCKTKIIRSFPRESVYRILIGDSVTDFAGARLADLVFARSHLKTQCDKENISYIPFEDFLTVKEALKNLIS